MSRDQSEAGVDHVAEADECRCAQQHAREDRQHAKGAVPAVAHNRELLFPIEAPKKPVGGVGETIFVQCSGQSETGKHRQQRRRPIPEANQLGQ